MSLRDYVDWNEGFAYIVVVVLVFVPTYAYWDYPDVFGSYPLVKLVAIGAIGGAVSFALYVEREERLLALVPGLVAGGGAVLLMTDYAPSLVPGSDRWGGSAELAFACLGATPGFALMWAFRRFAANRRGRNTHASSPRKRA